MVKALFGVALWLLLAAAAFSAGPSKKDPAWELLTPHQQQVLAPIRYEWPNLDAKRKQKWLSVAKRYDKMSPSEQTRLQERMREWVNLTPEQRQAARSRYREFERLPQDRKATARRDWERYQRQRTEAERAAEAARNATATPVPVPGSEPLAPGSEALGLRPR